MIVVNLLLVMGFTQTKSPGPPQPPGLLAPCVIISRPARFGGIVGRALWVDCGCQPVRVTEPNNLVSHVKLASAADALAYVRYFTLPPTFSYFHMNGAVELVSGKGDSQDEFNVVDKDRFSRYLHTPITKEFNDAGGQWFTISRIVFQPDNRIYEITEQVSPDGAYQEISRRIVFDDGEKIGLLFVGNN